MPKKAALLKQHQKTDSATLSSSEDEWEDVAESIAPNKEVEVQVELPDSLKSVQSKKTEQMKEWLLMFIKRAINKSSKEIQIRMHKLHLLCLIALGLQMNSICLDVELQCFALSLLDMDMTNIGHLNTSKENLLRLLNFLHQKFSIQKAEKKFTTNPFVNIFNKKNALKEIFGSCIVKDEIDLILPIPLKKLTEKQKQANKSKVESELKQARNKVNGVTGKKADSKSGEIRIPQLDGAFDDVLPRRRSLRVRNPASQSACKSTTDSPTRDDEAIANKNKRNASEGKRARKRNSKANDVTVSKYSFSGDESKLCSGDDVPAAGKIGALVKAAKAREETTETESDFNAKRLCKVDLKQDDRQITSKSNRKTSSKKKLQPSVNAKLRSGKHGAEATSGRSSAALKPSKLARVGEEKNRSDTKCSLESSSMKSRSLPSKLRQRSKEMTYADKNSDDDFVSGDSGDDFDKESFRKQTKTKVSKRNGAASSGKSSLKKSSAGPNVNQWLEVYMSDVGWVPLDCVSGSIVEPKEMEQRSSKPLHYVIAFDGDSHVKDVTVRYASDWLVTTRKLRVSSVDPTWWKETLKPFKTTNQDLDDEENKQLEGNLLSQPLPVSISAYKNHPLFALRRHLLKYEAIYPPDVPAIGLVKGEEILPRSSVHVLHTREKWLQSALSVKEGEAPYKMVASYLLNKKLNRDSNAPSLALFGKWQTETYRPPVAENGKVPRNDYGNVDLFMPSMLPIGCVHTRLPMLNVVARKLNIDVANAVVGFDTHNGYPHPVIDGYVICKEHEALLSEAWEEEQANVEEKAREKLEKRIYSKWKTLIRGLLALQRVRRKYGNKDEDNDGSSSKPFTNNNVAWQASKLKEAKSRYEKRGRRSRKTKDESFPVEVETL